MMRTLPKKEKMRVSIEFSITGLRAGYLQSAPCLHCRTTQRVPQRKRVAHLEFGDTR